MDTNRQNPTLTTKQRKAIAALVACSTVAEAALQGGFHRSQIYVWLRRPDFADALYRAQADAYKVALANIASRAERAADTLASLLDDPLPTVRLAAAKTLLDCAANHIMASDLERRVAELEGLRP